MRLFPFKLQPMDSEVAVDTDKRTHHRRHRQHGHHAPSHDLLLLSGNVKEMVLAGCRQPIIPSEAEESAHRAELHHKQESI